MGDGSTRAFRTVLIVEDDLPTLRAFGRSIASTGAVVLAAPNVETARRLAKLHDPDLAIVDLHIGCDSGIDLIQHLRSVNRPLAVVLISGYGSVENTVSAMKAGANDVLEKPVTYKEILRRLEGRPQPIRDFEPTTLARAQWEHVHRVLADCAGNVSMTARKLGVYRTTLRRWLRKRAPV